MLSVTGLNARYGAIRAVSGIDIEVAKGAFVAILGANGAGKSTFMKVLTGELGGSSANARSATRSLWGAEEAVS